ncbi:glycosyltransferase family 8 protein [Teratosphaeria destructans]|uniref:glycogenin glucosyltransferase n=1 Tax=Teratosphaeria destructans TaxID=418781 RepID=A0A9W7SVC1_9PEZI|nr:glycosyltransferase family 8 protein [Teratosphaeria destructans]
MAVGEDVYCTLVMTDAYLPGAAVLAHSLRDAGTTKKLACLITQDSLRDTTITELRSLYNHVIPIARIGNPSPANLYLMNRPDLLYTFTKINLWKLTEFRKIVYIDSDVVALRAPDELFDTQEDFAAAADVGWPDIFNTGVMVLSPSMGEYWALRRLASAGDSFDGADQGLLNQYFEHRPWKRLSFTYNCTPSANYQYEPAYRYFKRDISMVHFIGRNKPWQEGRAASSAPGVYQELSSRWWAVYDRHFRVTTHEYTATGRREPQHHAIHQQVSQGSETTVAAGYPLESTPSSPPSEAPYLDMRRQAGLKSQGWVAPPEPPTVGQRRFSAPCIEWDATRTAPPEQSRPEASNFPTQFYEFSKDPAPFKPPASYPAPPRDMWYQVPQEKPRPQYPPPQPIFPWEQRKDAPKATRVFSDETEPVPEPELEPDFAVGNELEVSLDEKKSSAEDLIEPKTPTIRVNDEAPWGGFGAVNRNAWDEVSGIEDYVRALTRFQKTRGQVQVLSDQTRASPGASGTEGILRPTAEIQPAELVEKVQTRRESLILTDFPSAVERPSLPVTPAPRRRPTFWGAERDDEGDLPAAEGVPHQAEWDPNAQLEKLRSNSLISPGDLKLPDKISLSQRGMPASSAPMTAEGAAHALAPHGADAASEPQGAYGNAAAGTISGPLNDTAQQGGKSAAGKIAAQAAPVFIEPTFSGPSAASAAKDEALLSPTDAP